jgi:hypothetical protein
MRKSLAIVISIVVSGTACLLAQDETKTHAQITKTERVEFPAGGVLRFDNAIGELTITGWDQPNVEITTIKSTRALYGPQQREKHVPDLEKIQIKTERHGNEVVVTTDFPRYAIFPPPLPWRSGHAQFDLEYRVSAPREARLVIDHNTGEVHVADVASDVHATVLKGSISLRVPEENQYAIDAKTDAGSIFSDFPGEMRSRLGLVGHRFNWKLSSPGHNLYLRVGYGDIAILKIRKPPYALYNKPAPGAQQ